MMRRSWCLASSPRTASWPTWPMHLANTSDHIRRELKPFRSRLIRHRNINPLPAAERGSSRKIWGIPAVCLRLRRSRWKRTVLTHTWAGPIQGKVRVPCILMRPSLLGPAIEFQGEEVTKSLHLPTNLDDWRARTHGFSWAIKPRCPHGSGPRQTVDSPLVADRCSESVLLQLILLPPQNMKCGRMLVEKVSIHAVRSQVGK